MSPLGGSGVAILSSAQMGLEYSASPISTTDGWLSRGGLTGIGDGAIILGNGWFRRTGGDGSARRIFTIHATFNSRLIIHLDTDNALKVEARNSSNTAILLAVGPTVTDSDWHQWAISLNLANAAQRNFMFDGADATPTWTTYTNDTIDLAPTSPQTVVARYQPTGSIQPWIGDLSDMWFSTPVAWVDLSSGGNLANFISSGKPVNPATAISAFGTPLVILQGDTSDFATNADGSGGAFTINGTLANGSGPVQL